MATRKQPAAPSAEVELDTIEPGPEDELGEVLAELGQGGGGKVKIERKRATDGRLEFVRRVDAGAFSLEWLQDEFGGGEYRLTVTDGRSRYVASKTVMIAQPAQPPKPAPAAEHAGLEKLAAAIQKQGELLAMMLMRPGGVASGAAAPADPAAIRKALLEDMLTMKQLFGAGGGNDTAKMLEVLKTGIELAKDAGGGGDGGGNWSGAIEKAIEVFGQPLAQALEHNAAAAASARAPAPAARVTVPAAPGAPPRLPKSNPQESNPMDIGKFLSFALTRSAAGSDPTLYAELILDAVPEPLIRAFLGDGDPAGLVERLAKLDPRVSQHAEWFRSLGQAVVEALSTDAAEPGLEPGADDGPAGGAA